MKSVLAILLIAVILHPASGFAADKWDTYYETSGYVRTPPYDETVAYCRRLAEASPRIHYTSFGVSPQGRDLPLLVVDREGRFTPGDVRTSDNVVFLIQAGIHSGEIDGKDAGLMLIRDLVMRAEHSELLDHVTILFIPIYNVDGHERSSRFNRPNQNGPEEMGWRATATNLNLNRDYLKADAPETRAWLRLYGEWLPEFLADCHVTDGADYQYVVSQAVEIYGGTDPALAQWTRDRYLAPVETRMDHAGFPLSRYNWYRDEHDPRSGIVSWVSPPRFSTGYAAIRNRAGVLIETHSLKDYHTRVTGTYEMLLATLEVLNREHAKLRELCSAADEHTAASTFRREPYVLTWKVSPDSVMIDFLGYDYKVVKSDLTGGDWYQFSDRKRTMRIPWFDKQVPVKQTTLPEGYLLPPEWQDVVELLELHGVSFERLGRDAELEVETYRFENTGWQVKPYEGRHPVTFKMRRGMETRAFPKGTLVIDMNQRGARVAAQILEPDAPDSYVYWGFFDSVLEKKEYIESYVIEELGREMLAADPALRDALEEKKRSDEKFASDPEAIRMWLYVRSPYWDHRFNLYPVGRVLARDALDSLPR